MPLPFGFVRKNELGRFDRRRVGGCGHDKVEE